MTRINCAKRVYVIYMIGEEDMLDNLVFEYRSDAVKHMEKYIKEHGFIDKPDIWVEGLRFITLEVNIT